MTANGKGVPLVQQDAQQLRAFEDRPQRPGNRRMATLPAVYSVDRFVRKPQEIVSALFREECTDLKPTRPRPQHQRLNARLPSTVEGLDDEIIRGSIQSLTWADREVSLRRRPDQLLIRLMDGQRSLWSDADACQENISKSQCMDILDIVHVAGCVWKSAKALYSNSTDQQAFARERNA